MRSFLGIIWIILALLFAGMAEARIYGPSDFTSISGKHSNAWSNTDFTSAAVSASGLTITFAGGDPIASGMTIGMRLTFTNMSVSANNTTFKITGFSGTSNRIVAVVAVSPAPADQSADTSFNITSTDGTLTFGGGDPVVTNSWGQGDAFALRGTSADRAYLIENFGGTTNRTMLVIPPPPADFSADTSFTLEHAKIVKLSDRFYHVFEPAGMSGNHCVIMAIHPAFTNGPTYLYDLNIATLSEASTSKCAVVFPSGIGFPSYYSGIPLSVLELWSSNLAVCCRTSFRASVDDNEWIHDVIADMTIRQNIDATKVYLTGYSNGAILALGYLCHYPSDIKAVSINAGALVVDHDSCTNSLAGKQIQWTHGYNDGNIPIKGGHAGVGICTYPSMPANKAYLESLGATVHVIVPNSVDGCGDLTIGHCLTGMNTALAAVDALCVPAVTGLALKTSVTDNNGITATTETTYPYCLGASVAARFVNMTDGDGAWTP